MKSLTATSKIVPIIKSTFIFTLLLLATSKINGQPYFPFPEEGAQWNIFLAETCDEVPPDTFVLRYTICGDTIINDKEFKKLCREMGDPSNPILTAIGGFRETDKKIYYSGDDFRGVPLEKEYLLYDFGINVGDTVWHDNRNIFSVISEIDSILIGDNYRKRFKVYNYNPDDVDYWVEGIGSLQGGLLGHITAIPTCGVHHWEHICFKEGGEVVYLNPDYNDCYPSNLVDAVSEKQLLEEINIYPNPFSETITIDNLPIAKSHSIEIYDFTGRCVLKKGLQGNGAEISLPKQREFLLLMIKDESGKIVYREKLIQQ